MGSRIGFGEGCFFFFLEQCIKKWIRLFIPRRRYRSPERCRRRRCRSPSLPLFHFRLCPKSRVPVRDERKVDLALSRLFVQRLRYRSPYR